MQIFSWIFLKLCKTELINFSEKPFASTQFSCNTFYFNPKHTSGTLPHICKYEWQKSNVCSTFIDFIDYHLMESKQIYPPLSWRVFGGGVGLVGDVRQPQAAIRFYCTLTHI